MIGLDLFEGDLNLDLLKRIILRKACVENAIVKILLLKTSSIFKNCLKCYKYFKIVKNSHKLNNIIKSVLIG